MESSINTSVPVRLLLDLVDDEPCEIDHNNSCQSHGYFYLRDGELCPQYELKLLVTRWVSDNPT